MLPESEMDRRADPCVLLFSGGRDSTLAAVRLARTGAILTLVTVTSTHLVGIDAVRSRLSELKPHLPGTTVWMHVVQPTDLPEDPGLRSPTCLPCHQSYAATGAVMARRFNARRLAFGYAGYQSDWPEQGPDAICRLTALLAQQGIELVLPVYDLDTKEAAVDELKAYGLSPIALEQKCLQQQFNIPLSATSLEDELAGWERALVATLSSIDRLSIRIITQSSLADLGGA